MKDSRYYQLMVDLNEMRLFQRLRQLRRQSESVILLIEAATCAEVGSLPGQQQPAGITRFNSREKG